MSIRFVFVFLFAVISVQPLSGQQENRSLVDIKSTLAKLSDQESLDAKVTISFNGNISEMVTFLAESTTLNLSVAKSIKREEISVAFTDAAARDIIIYLCDAYQLDLKLTGSIIQFIPYQPPAPEVIPKPVDITYDTSNQLLSLNLSADTLAKVVQRIANLTGNNIAVEPSIANTLIQGFIKAANIENVLAQIADNNNLIIENREDYFYFKSNQNDNTTGNSNFQPNTVSNLTVRPTGNGKVNITGSNVAALDIIEQAAFRLEETFILLPDVATGNNDSNSNQNNNFNRSRNNETNTLSVDRSEQLNIQLNEVDFIEVLTYICQNTPYTYHKENDVFIIGSIGKEALRSTRVVNLIHRSLQGVIEHIPPELTADVYIDTLNELNSVIIHGAEQNVATVDSFIKMIDRRVPVVMIDLVIVDVQTNNIRDIGLEAGVAPNGAPPPGGVISSDGGFDFTFSSKAINDLLQILSGRGIVNIGQVNNNFYLSLRAVEELGVVEVQSTPQLATLNSHSAYLSIGQKRYYQEQQFSFPGIDNPIPIQSNQFKSVEANLDIQITPMVSGDEQVTMEIFFEQSEFTSFPENAPPPQVSRKFESMIRVKNGEMIVLGGLERDLDSKTRRGLPFLSRIPVIGWLFGKHRRNKTNEKLLIFVRPSIIK